MPRAVAPFTPISRMMRSAWRTTSHARTRFAASAPNTGQKPYVPISISEVVSVAGPAMIGVPSGTTPSVAADLGEEERAPSRSRSPIAKTSSSAPPAIMKSST